MNARPDPTWPLPRQLGERTRLLRDGEIGAGRYVLYWMRTALRGHENPALEVALRVANAHQLPVLVYQGLSERYPFASDRHHAFILQATGELRDELEERGVRYLLHVARDGHRAPHLAQLAAGAAAVVTEEMPVVPLRPWTEALAAGTSTPMLTVDTACVVPMLMSPWPVERAFEYRRATAAVRSHRIDEEWTEVEPDCPPWDEDPPFEPIDPATVDLTALLGECTIQHDVAPVAHSSGGSRAGYERWETFRDGELDGYRRRRNDPLAGSVSRLSAYLHYGMVSPFRIAREAHAIGSEGARKFLDELIVWRELAYAFCFHEPRHMSLDALPRWARETLAAHASDPRPALHSWETLAHARTGDPLWDAAQRSLLVHGELHNNLRMTWGKALVSWTPNAGAALHALEDLNHRYALDGRDPASYGGILWCLGLFDRPFPPERPILGTVRERPLDRHAQRLDVGEYLRHTSRALVEKPPTVAVIGAGVAGLACARALADHGLAVRILDRGRRPGGRLASHTVDDVTFDSGAQYFTLRDPRFQPRRDSWRQDGVIALWPGRIGTLENGRIEPAGPMERWVATPDMNRLARHLAAGLEIRSDCEVTSLDRAGEGWEIGTQSGETERAERVVLATAAPQALRLLSPGSTVHRQVAAVEMKPSWAVMALFEDRVPLELDGAFVRAPALSWAARDSSKPGRAPAEAWVLHATADWSRKRLDADPREVSAELLTAFASALARELPAVRAVRAHRWSFAGTEKPFGGDHLVDRETGLILCGDWFPGGRVEGAYASGIAAAGSLLRRLTLGGRELRGGVSRI